MQQHSIGYIIGFSAAVCVVCAFFVAGSAVSLKSRQDLNILLDRQKNVLTVAGLMQPGESLGADELGRRFDESIRPLVVDLETGQVAEGVEPTTFDQRVAAKDPATSKRAPDNRSRVLRVPTNALVYQVMEKGEVESLILPIEGYGLWSTLYGYIAIAADATTVRGITYYEHGETAGLGGEVDNPRWKAKWVGRKAFNERWRPVIQVIKGTAGPPDEDPYDVDGISGATITSRGVTNMLRFWLGDSGFGPYLAQYRQEKGI